MYPLSCGKGGWGSGEIETTEVVGKRNELLCGKGGWGSGEIETAVNVVAVVEMTWWKGWMGLRRD